MKLRGCGTALVTPFKRDGSIDEVALRQLVRWQVDSGIDFLVPCGTTGETPTLSHDEWLHVIDITIEAAQGRVPIMAGATSNNTQDAVAKAKEAPQRRESTSSCRPRRTTTSRRRTGLSAFQSDRRRLAEAAGAVQHRRTHWNEHRNRRRCGVWPKFPTSSGQRSQRQHFADCGSVCDGPGRLSGVFRR